MWGSKSLTSSIKDIIIQAEQIGLPQKDIQIATEFVEHQEFSLALEQVIEQLFEFDIQINQQLYNSIESSAQTMKMDETKYSFLKELIATN